MQIKKCLIPLLLAVCLLAGCGVSEPAREEGVTVVATTYPIYLFASAVTAEVDGVTVERLNTGSVSCLHDYTLSMNDMKKIEQADVIVMNGAELESFMEDALVTSDAAVIDCSQGVTLLENLSHHHVEEEMAHDHQEHHTEEAHHDHEEASGHDHEEEHEDAAPVLDDHGHDHGHWDPHYWMAPENACIMVDNLYHGLAEVLPQAEALIRDNAEKTVGELAACDAQMRDYMAALAVEGVTIEGLITFHDGFQYFAHTYNMPLLEAIEEEAGSEASAKEIVEITHLVREHGLPLIFTEVNGSDATANAISRETGCGVEQLSMIMDGPDVTEGAATPVTYYTGAMLENIAAVLNGFAGEQVVNVG